MAASTLYTANDPRDAFAKHFAKIVASAITIERGARRLDGLDLSCGRGEVALEVANKLPDASRIVAVGDDRPQLDAFHQRLGRMLDKSRSVFPRYEQVDKLPFADGVFDRVWAGLATTQLEPAKPALRQAIRVLRPGGQLVIAAILRDTVVDFMRLISAFIDAHEDSARMRPMILDQARAMDKAAWEDAIRRAGAIELEVTTQKFDWTVTVPISRDPVMQDCLGPIALGGDVRTRAETLSYFDAIVKEPLVVPITIARLVCRRGMTEIE